MSTEGVDYSFTKPGGAALKAAGKSFVIRYVYYEGTGKALNAAERDDLQDHGLDLAMVFERYAMRPLEGWGAGVEDAQRSNSELHALGFPPDSPVYFAIDWDSQASEQAAIDNYLRGCASVIGLDRVGVYGNYYSVDRCHRNGTARWFWQHNWGSDGKVHPEAHLHQYKIDTNMSGTGSGALDLNRALKADFGQWKAPGFIPALPKPVSSLPVWEQLWTYMSWRFPTLRLTSSVRRLSNGQLDPGTYHGSYGANDCCADDIAGVLPDPDGNALTIEAFRWAVTTWPNITEAIHTPAGPEWQVKRGVRGYAYGPETVATHGDHMHLAYDIAVVPPPAGYNTVSAPTVLIKGAPPMDMLVLAVQKDADPEADSGYHAVFTGGGFSFGMPVGKANAEALLKARKDSVPALIGTVDFDRFFNELARATGQKRETL